uniref:Uncharacterized protein n=1 Tax=Arundo donax TaxID=35708 RepID=A0A0A9C8W6_ARUDO
MIQGRQRRAGAEGHASVGGAGLELVVEGGGVRVGVACGEGGVHDEDDGGVVGGGGGGGVEQREARAAGRPEGQPQDDEGQRQHRRRRADDQRPPAPAAAAAAVVVLPAGPGGAIPRGVLRIIRDQRHTADSIRRSIW